MRDNRIGSLFSGIGGLELGLELAGCGQTIWQVEQDEYARKVLQKHWPNALRFGDVRDVGSHNLPPVELVCGGFPCQDLSYAGRGAGLAGARSGLWVEFARVVREIRPRFVVVENVSALRNRGLGVVLGDLASVGYDAIWTCVSASEVGAPHKRERLFVLGWNQLADSNRAWKFKSEGFFSDVARRASHGGEPVSVGQADTDWEGLEVECVERGYAQSQRAPAQRNRANGDRARAIGRVSRGGSTQSRSAEPRVVRDSHGISSGVDGHRWPAGRGQTQHPWEPPRTAYGIPNREDRIRCLGNAVVPKVAAVIGRIVLELEKGMK